MSDEVNLEIIRKAISIFYPELSGEEIEFVGMGTYARAYKVGKLVFKVTSDEDDAIASARVLNKDLVHLVKIHKVLKVHSRYKWLIVSNFVEHTLRSAEKYKGIRRKVIQDIHNSFVEHLYLRKGIDKVHFEFGLNEVVTKELRAFFKELVDNNFSNADIQPDNIRVGSDGVFKLIDLGHMTSQREERTVKFEELV